MRNLKFFTLSFILFCLSSLNSCSEESSGIENQEISETYKTAAFFEKSVELISNEIKEKMKNSKDEEFELTQAELDQYLDIAGYNGPVPSLEDVNTIINQTIAATHDGTITFPLPNNEYPPLSNKTNNLLDQIFTEGSIQDLKANANYQSVSYSEQQLLEYINNLVTAWENGEIDFGIAGKELALCGINGNSVPCWMAGAAAGAALGSVFGGGGAIIGGIVGGVVGSLIDAT